MIIHSFKLKVDVYLCMCGCTHMWGELIMNKFFIYPLLLVFISVSVAGCGGDSGDVVSSSNAAPVADAGADRNIMTGVLTTLDGSGSSDPDGDSITYDWSFDSLPPASQSVLVQSTTVQPSFTPDFDGIYILSLTVNDGTVDSAADTVTLTASLAANNPPTADAGGDKNIITGVVTTLDGSASSDPDGDPITYLWSLDSAPAGSMEVLYDDTAVNPTFTADLDGDYTISLIVSDGVENSIADVITLTASSVAVNNPPIADAGADTNVATGVTVILDGSNSSDPDGDPISYLWSLVTRPATSTAVLSSAIAVKPSFVADIAGEYRVDLVVNDGTVDSTADSVIVTATALPSASFLAGRLKYDNDCAYCHAAGSHDTSTANGGNELYLKSALLRTDISFYSKKKVGVVDDLTAQEIIDLTAFLDDPSIAP
jgi:hypothetical protein